MAAAFAGGMDGVLRARGLDKGPFLFSVALGVESFDLEPRYHSFEEADAGKGLAEWIVSQMKWTDRAQISRSVIDVIRDEMK